MELAPMKQHTLREFDQDLEMVRGHVLTMGGLVESQVELALRALIEGDGELGVEVNQRDYAVNSHEIKIDEECMQVLVRHQPVAVDLRLIIASFKIITDLERIGDEAAKIGRQATAIAADRDGFRGYGDVRHLGRYVREMLHDALNSFARTDAELALQVIDRDDDADREYETIIRQLSTYMMEDASTIGEAVSVMWAARSLERVGDHARNIAEHVVFLVGGHDIRHQDPEIMRQLLERQTKMRSAAPSSPAEGVDHS
jgi:phosphate transport system protein